MIPLHLRGIHSHQKSIKDMAGRPSRAELLELARQRIRAERYSAIPAVRDQIARLKESKLRAADEDGRDELPTTSIFDLTRVILDTSCRVTDDSSSKCWEVTFEGPDLVGNPLKVMAILSKDENGVLIITSFQPMIRSTP